MKVLILTEGGTNIGFGHIARCLALCQAFEERGVIPRFLINGDASINDMLKGQDYRIFDWIREKEQLQQMLQGAEVVVIDSYLANPGFYREISKKTKISVYIDDNMRLKYPDGILINGNIYAEELNFPKKNGIIYLLGCRYTPLRKEFWDVPKKTINETVKEIMVTFGGNDAKGMTPIVLQLLIKNYPDLIKKVVLEKAFSNSIEIEKLRDSRTELIYGPNALAMRQLMLDADIAISSGGQTLYELAMLGIPSIAIAVAKNQLNNVKYWQKVGFVNYAGDWRNKGNIIKGVCKQLDKLNDCETRKKSSAIGSEFIDGQGCLRAVDFLLKLKWRKINGR